jgi:hypothetical protein
MKILYLTYENVFKTGILQAQVVTPLSILNSRKGVNFVVTSIVKESETADEIYLKNKDNSLRSTNLIFKEFTKRLTTSQNVFVFLIDILNMFKGSYQLAKTCDLIHARGYGGAFVALLLNFFLNKKYIFDMRGVLPEETVFVGKIKVTSFKFKLMKFVEKKLLKKASYVFVVSEPFRKYIEGFELKKPIYNIRNPADFSLYERKKGWDKINILYSGSLQNWHCADEVYQFFRRIKDDFKERVNLIVCANDLDGHKKLITKNGLSESDINISRVPFHDMPKVISNCHIGFCLTKKTFLTSVCLPVKFGEYIAGNLSVIGNKGIGDIDKIVNKFKAGLIFSEPECNDRNYAEVKVLIEKLESKKESEYCNEDLLFLDWDLVTDEIYNVYEEVLSE